MAGVDGNAILGREYRRLEPMEMNTALSDAPVATDQTYLGDRGAAMVDDPDDMRCYCGRDRDMEAVEFQCGMCLRFYHSDCMTCTTKPCVPFMTNYQFFCRRCDCNEQEIFTKRQASFSQMCLSAVANLMLHNPDTEYFSKDKEIIPYIEKHWESLTTQPRRVKSTWHTTIGKTMMKDSEIFQYKEDSPGDMYVQLINQDLKTLGPNPENLQKLSGATCKYNDSKSSCGSDSKTRGTKRKAISDVQSGGVRLKRSEMAAASKLSVHGYPLEHPFNKDDYRYILAESDPHAPNRRAFDEGLEWAGKPIPGYLYRVYLGNAVLLALHDRAPQLKISDDRLTVTGDKGYCMVRATHGVLRGSWYYEVTITEMPAESCVRMGWSLQTGNLQAPCGYDKFSYSWRAKKGTVFHESRGKHFSEGYREGDVVGFYISLPQPEDPCKLLPFIYKDMPLVKFKSHLYYEEKDPVGKGSKQLEPCNTSKIMLFKNGKGQGVAFQDISGGVYYPAISLYKSASVAVNFGPDFKCPPKDCDVYKPMSEAAVDAIVDHTLCDLLYHIEHEGQLPEF